MSRRSRNAKLVAWICLLAMFCVATDLAQLDLSLDATLGRPEPFFVPDGCFGGPPLPQALALPTDAGRAPPLS